MVQVSKQSFWDRLSSGRNTFTHAARKFQKKISDSQIESQMLSNEASHAHCPPAGAPLQMILRWQKFGKNWRQ